MTFALKKKARIAANTGGKADRAVHMVSSDEDVTVVSDEYENGIGDENVDLVGGYLGSRR